ncbi:MAG: flavin reductase family protein [Verrucomicrobiales bacterium]
MDQDKVAPALGKIASGLYIATATDSGGNPVGMLCSFVEQAGFEPPMITIAIGPDRRLAKALVDGGKLGLNVLGKSNGGALMKPFVSSGDANPFTGIALTANHHGIPQLSDALAFLACELRDQMPAGDHTIYLCEVIDGRMPVTPEKDEPMIRIRANGFGY